MTATPKAEDPLIKENHRSFFLTFSTAVSIPGVTLAAGTVPVQVPLRNRALASSRCSTLTARPNTRCFRRPRYKTPRGICFSNAQVMMWRERQAGMPPEIKELYLPGRSIGYEFIYPKKTT